MRFADLGAVTVDGYGTLLELEDPVKPLAEALETHGIRRSPPEVAEAFAKEAAYYRPRSHLARDPAIAGAAATRMRGASSSTRCTHRSTPGDFVGAFMGAIVFRPADGAVEALGVLRARGLKLAVVSNWDCSLPERLETLDLLSFFDTVVTSAEAGVPKPDPAPFRLALERLGTAPDRALHVGDEPSDEQGAAAAGMRFAPAPLSIGRRRRSRDRQARCLVDVRRCLRRARLCQPGERGRPAGGCAVPVQHRLERRHLVRRSRCSSSSGSHAGRHRELLALRAPRSWSGAVGWSIAVIVAVFVVEAVLEPFLNAGEEQGLTPDTWEPDRAGAYAANAVVIAVIAPIVEELMFRGAGYSLLARFGQVVAIVAVGVLFGLVHGLDRRPGCPVGLRHRVGVAASEDRQRVSVHRRARTVQRRGADRCRDRDDLSGLYPRGVRTAVALGIFLALAAPAAAAGEETTLTLRAPGATKFGHVVDFAGRLSPARPGTRVSLMRGMTRVASMGAPPRRLVPLPGLPRPPGTVPHGGSRRLVETRLRAHHPQAAGEARRYSRRR